MWERPYAAVYRSRCRRSRDEDSRNGDQVRERPDAAVWRDRWENTSFPAAFVLVAAVWWRSKEAAASVPAARRSGFTWPLRVKKVNIFRVWPDNYQFVFWLTQVCWVKPGSTLSYYKGPSDLIVGSYLVFYQITKELLGEKSYLDHFSLVIAWLSWSLIMFSTKSSLILGLIMESSE